LLLVRTYVAASAVEGVGVFAAEPIATGQQIWRFDRDFDQLIPEERYASAPEHLRDFLDRYAYPSPDHPGFLVYETDNGRFMNHSDEPNTNFSGTSGGTALRDIAAGEELTCNYSDFFPSFELVPSAAAFAEARPAERTGA
jgi:uncharacterized protein